MGEVVQPWKDLQIFINESSREVTVCALALKDVMKPQEGSWVVNESSAAEARIQVRVGAALTVFLSIKKPVLVQGSWVTLPHLDSGCPTLCYVMVGGTVVEDGHPNTVAFAHKISMYVNPYIHDVHMILYSCYMIIYGYLNRMVTMRYVLALTPATITSMLDFRIDATGKEYWSTIQAPKPCCRLCYPIIWKW